MEIVAEVELYEFEQALYRLARETNKDFGTIIRQQSRLLAVNLAISTQPFSGGQGNFKDGAIYSGLNDRKIGEAAVRRDIGRVYRSISAIFEQIKRKLGGEDAARGFYAAAMNRRFREAQRILDSVGVFDSHAPIGRFDQGKLHKQRRDRRGRVNNRRASMIPTNQRSVEAYSKKVQRRVGIAKGGWAQCARELGGVRGLPQWVTRHGKGGHVQDHTHKLNDPGLVLTNTVPWVNRALSPGARASAIKFQQEKMMAHIERVIEYNARKAGFATAQ